MSYFVRNAEGLSQATTNSQSRVPLRTQLARAHTRDQLYELVRDEFLPKLCSLFQMDPNKASRETLFGMRLDEMGIDSLLAVEIRGWFMKTLEANIPVLKILSGILIADLIAMATDKIPQRLVPDLIFDQMQIPTATFLIQWHLAQIRRIQKRTVAASLTPAARAVRPPLRRPLVNLMPS